MFNNVALDVAIGIVLVYLLYSLLVTIIGEMIATALGTRASVLRVSIERMLNDSNPAKTSLWKSLKSAFEILFASQPASFASKFQLFCAEIIKIFVPDNTVLKNNLADKFYQYPSIKYLSKVDEGQATFGKTRPSYISPDNFATTVLNILSDDGKGDTKIDQIAACLKFNTLRIQPETIKQLRNLYNLSSNNIDNFKTQLIIWYNETQDRTNGWYKRKMKGISFGIGFLIALSFNVDSIKIARILSNDKDARNQLVTMGVALSKDTGRYSGYIHAGRDSVHKQSVIDSGFSHVSGDISKANMVLGLGWGFKTLMPEKLEIKDETKYKEYQGYAIAIDTLSHAVARIAKTINKNKNDIANITASIKLLAQDTVFKKHQASRLSQPEKDAAIKALLPEFEQINNDNVAINHTLLAIKKDSSRISTLNTLIDYGRIIINIRNGTNFMRISPIRCACDKKTVFITGYRYPTTFEKLTKILGAIFTLSFFGFLITALALSLGAPFWFGVLNKLVSLRGAGVKPEEKKPDSTVQAPAISPEGAAPVAAPLLSTDALTTSVEELNFRYKNYSGLIGILAGYIQQDNNVIRSIEIHAVSQSVLDALKILISDTYNSIPVIYMINTIINNQLGGGDAIFDSDVNVEAGTLGCLAKRYDDTGKRYIMSCRHVFQNIGDSVDAQGNGTIGFVSDGRISDKFDVAFVQLNISDSLATFNADIGIKGKCRNVTPADPLKTTVSFTGMKSNNVQNLTICNDSLPARDVRDTVTGKVNSLTDLFCIAKVDPNTKAILGPGSDDGDSGSLIIDSNGIPVGILVGRDKNYTYGAKLSNIFDPNPEAGAYPQYYIPF